MYKMAWAARNYAIHLKITNGIGSLMANFLCFVGYMFVIGFNNVFLFDLRAVVGFFAGSSLMYLIRGIQTYAVKNIAERVVFQ